MWQTAAVLLIVAGVVLYLLRHYLRVFRAQESPCASCACSECSSRSQAAHTPCDCATPRELPEEGGGVRP